MTKTINFKNKWGDLVKFLIDKYMESNVDPVLDPEVMSELGFSPQSWRVWKPQFISMSQKPIKILRNNEGNIIHLYHIVYDKKQKSWIVTQTTTINTKE